MDDDRRHIDDYISETYHDNKNDEIINVKLPRAKYEVLRKMIEREETYSWLKSTMTSSWIWVVAGGVLALITLWDKIHLLFIKG